MGINCVVIDTETNFKDIVMSIGVLIFEYDTFKIFEKKYLILSPEYKYGGMYSSVLYDTRDNEIQTVERRGAISIIQELFKKYDIKFIFAYNASFDKNKLNELSSFNWLDIMNVAANKFLNNKLPTSGAYYPSGKLIRGYGVEMMYRYMIDKKYKEIHNAICDVEDEFEILKSLNKPIEIFIEYNQKTGKKHR